MDGPAVFFLDSWLSFYFPDALSEVDESRISPAAIKRVVSMISYVMEAKLGPSRPMVMTYCSMICLIMTRVSISCTNIPETVMQISDEYGIGWKEDL